MKKYLRKVKLWVLEQYYSGEAWSHFLLGCLGLVILVLASIVIGYVK